MTGAHHDDGQGATGPRCILPGCGAPASEQGMPCAECAAAFGAHLRQTEGPAMTAEAQARRDTETHTAYVVLLTGGDPARVAGAGEPAFEESPFRGGAGAQGQPAVLDLRGAPHLHQAGPRVGMRRLPEDPLAVMFHDVRYTN
jgi:hypothetical protein